MPLMRWAMFVFMGVATGAVVCQDAHAGNGSGQGMGLPSDGLSIGAGVNVTDPGYVGYHSQVTPFPLFNYRLDGFFISGVTAGYVAVQNEAYSLSFVVVPQTMRLRASESPQLAGLQPREWSVDGGVSLSLKREWGALSLRALQDLLGRNKGTELGLQYAYPVHLGNGVLSPGLGVSWESADLTRYYYGISDAEALPNRPAYSPGSALNPSVMLSYAVPLWQHWRLAASASVTHLDSSIRNSPIIDKSNVMGVTLAVTYTFPQH